MAKTEATAGTSASGIQDDELTLREALQRWFNELVLNNIMTSEQASRLLSLYDSASIPVDIGKPGANLGNIGLVNENKAILASFAPMLALATDKDENVRRNYISKAKAETKRKQDIVNAFDTPYSGSSNRNDYYDSLSNRLNTAKQLAAAETDPDFKAILEGVVADSQKLLNSTLEADVFTEKQGRLKSDAERIKAFEGTGGVGRGLDILAEANREFAAGLDPQEYQLPPLHSGQEDINSFLTQFSPNLRDYFSNKTKEITDPIANARKLWWETVHATEKRAFEAQQNVNRTRAEWNAALTATSRYNKEAATVYPFGQKPPLAIDEAGARRRYENALGAQKGIDYQTSVLGGLTGSALDIKQNPGEDPLKAYLKEYPFMSKFLTVAPRQRGEFTRTSAPPAIWGSRY